MHLVTDIAEAQAVVRRTLRRRLTTPRRIGVPYRVMGCYDAGCWLAMMGFQLIDGHLAITVPELITRRFVAAARSAQRRGVEL